MVAAEVHHELSGPDDAPVVVLSCSLGTDRSMWDPQARARGVREHGIEPLVDAAIDRWFTSAFAQEHPEVVQPRCQKLLATPVEGYAACCEALADMDLRDSLSAVRAPTLVVSGREDPATPPEHGRVIADGIAGAQFEIIDDAAHLANLQQPDLVSGLIERHLTRRSP